jgi:hypothetical protein
LPPNEANSGVKAPRRADVGSGVLTALCALAKHLDISEVDVWTAKQNRRINRAISRKRHGKLTTWHLKHRQSNLAPVQATIPKAILQAVFLKSELTKSRRSSDSDDLIKRAKQVKIEDLRPVEQRAAALLAGAKKKPAKNAIEISAEKLATSIRPGWKSKKGRPDGSGSSKVSLASLQYRVPLSAIDVCAAVLPIIEEITMSQMKPVGWNAEVTNDDPALNVVVAAVVAEIRTTKPASVVRAIYRLKAAKA